MTAPVDLVYVRDRSSGRFHKRVRVDGVRSLAAFEACNSDSSGAFDIVPESAVDAGEPEDKCRRCFSVEHE